MSDSKETELETLKKELDKYAEIVDNVVHELKEIKNLLTRSEQ